MGNLLQVTEPNPGGGADFETYYTYDTLNNLTYVAMPRNGYTQTRSFTYQGKWLMSATNPENGTTTYTYNSDGTLATRTDQAGRRFEHDYDIHGRLTAIRVMGYDHWGQWSELSRKEYQYDTNNIAPAVTENGVGRLAAAIEGGITYLYSYTQGGLIKTKQMRIAGWTGTPQMPLTANWNYDNEGRITSIKYPSGKVYLYGYDAMGRPRTLSRENQEGDPTVIVKETQYNAGGQLTRMDYDVIYSTFTTCRRSISTT
jgi:RHS Repeat.